MDVEDAGTTVRYLVRDRDAKYPAFIDEILRTAGIETVLTGVCMPRMNSIMERWLRTLHAELLDRTLPWNGQHLRRTVHEYERHHNEHRTHRSLHAAAPLRLLLEPITGPVQITHLDIRRHDRLGRVSDPRVPTRGLTSADGIFGTYKADACCARAADVMWGEAW
ncbi:integrase core domain-containing protein [Streptomyces mirabilis]|uniref:integrase core domain-containing protein n=1 Tax=Streptomyces mirabilis TaxID=68239 RepID=UPI00365C6281